MLYSQLSSLVAILKHVSVEHTVSESGEYEFFECEAEQVDGSEPLPLHSCELCGFTTHTILDLKEHIKVHTGEVAPTTTKANTPYFISCDECDFRALRKIDIGRFVCNTFFQNGL